MRDGAGAANARDSRHAKDRRKSRIAAWVVFGVILAILGGITAGGFYVWNTYEDKIRAFMGWEEPKDYEAGLATGEALVTIVSGDTGSTISQTLYEAGVTKTPEAFYGVGGGRTEVGVNGRSHLGFVRTQKRIAVELTLQGRGNRRLFLCP